MTKYRTRGRPRKTPYNTVKQPTERLKSTVYNDTFVKEKNEVHVPLHLYATPPNTTHLLSFFSNFETFYLKRNSLCPAWQS